MTGPEKDLHISSIKLGSVTYETNVGKADLLFDVLSGVSTNSNYTPTLQIHKQQFEQQHNMFLHGHYTDSNPTIETNHLNSDFTLHKLVSSIHRSKTRSAPGVDDLSNHIIKQIPLSSLNTLQHIYNLL